MCVTRKTSTQHSTLCHRLQEQTLKIFDLHVNILLKANFKSSPTREPMAFHWRFPAAFDSNMRDVAIRFRCSTKWNIPAVQNTPPPAHANVLCWRSWLQSVVKVMPSSVHFSFSTASLQNTVTHCLFGSSACHVNTTHTHTLSLNRLGSGTKLPARTLFLRCRILLLLLLSITYLGSHNLPLELPSTTSEDITTNKCPL